MMFDENEISGYFQRFLMPTGQGFMQTKPILVINQSHLLILRTK